MPILVNSHRWCISKSVGNDNIVAATSNVAGEEGIVTGLSIERIIYSGNVVISRQGANIEFALNGNGDIDTQGTGNLSPAANIVVTIVPATTQPTGTCILHLKKRY